MVIKTSSLHYKVFDFLKTYSGHKYNKDYPRTLCSYFWSFVGYAIQSLFFTAVFITFVSIVPVLLWSRFHNHSHDAGLALTLISSFVALLMGLAFLCKLNDKIDDPNDQSVSFLRVVKEVAKSGKNKVCPMVNYE